jgi:primary-amine oxidase
MHPLDPLTPAEIAAATRILKSRNQGNSLHFKNITLIEPPKKGLRKYLAAERSGKVVPDPPRRISALYYHRDTADLFCATVDLRAAKVEKVEQLNARYFGQADIDEVIEVRQRCLSHPKVIERIKSYGLPDSFTVVCDTWPYGRDSAELGRRLAQVRPEFLSQKGQSIGA